MVPQHIESAKAARVVIQVDPESGDHPTKYEVNIIRGSNKIPLISRLPFVVIFFSSFSLPNTICCLHCN
jgi:hypothetical protein